MAKDPNDPGTLELPLSPPAPCGHTHVSRKLTDQHYPDWTCMRCSARLTTNQVWKDA